MGLAGCFLILDVFCSLVEYFVYIVSFSVLNNAEGSCKPNPEILF